MEPKTVCLRLLGWRYLAVIPQTNWTSPNSAGPNGPDSVASASSCLIFQDCHLNPFCSRRVLGLDPASENHPRGYQGHDHSALCMRLDSIVHTHVVPTAFRMSLAWRRSPRCSPARLIGICARAQLTIYGRNCFANAQMATKSLKGTLSKTYNVMPMT